MRNIKKKKKCFFLQAEDGIRNAQGSRGLGDVYKRQEQRMHCGSSLRSIASGPDYRSYQRLDRRRCLLYTSDAADDLLCVDPGGRRIIKTTPTDNSPELNPLRLRAIEHTALLTRVD